MENALKKLKYQIPLLDSQNPLTTAFIKRANEPNSSLCLNSFDFVILSVYIYIHTHTILGTDNVFLSNFNLDCLIIRTTHI